MAVAIQNPSAASSMRPPGRRCPCPTYPETTRSSRSGRRASHALGEVELLADLVHQRELGLQVVDVVLLVLEDLLEQHGADVVLLLAAHRDAGAEPVDDLDLDREVRLELLPQGLP